MMDRRLKERLVGATILVAVIVLVVPELLSGPKHPLSPAEAGGPPTAPTRSVSVDLATNRATADPAGAPTPMSETSASNTPAANGAGGAMGAAVPSGASAQATPANAPSVATLKAQSGAQAALETPASPPKSVAMATRPAGSAEASNAPRRTWAVQLGSFASKANAERLVRRLQSAGGSFYIAPEGAGPQLRYRVRMGPLADRGAAERALARLKAQGHPATLVTPLS
jgi:DedD protein